MPWHRVVLPLQAEIDPNVVKMGDIAKASYEREGEPEGFAMYHATDGVSMDEQDKFIVYLTPVAYEICGKEIAESYTLEPCPVPARDEPNAWFVFGDARTKNLLQDSVATKSMEI